MNSLSAPTTVTATATATTTTPRDTIVSTNGNFSLPSSQMNHGPIVSNVNRNSGVATQAVTPQQQRNTPRKSTLPNSSNNHYDLTTTMRHHSGLSPSHGNTNTNNSMITPRREKSGTMTHNIKTLDRIKELSTTTTTTSSSEDETEDEDDPEMILISEQVLSQQQQQQQQQQAQQQQQQNQQHHPQTNNESHLKTPAHGLRRTPGASQSYRPTVFVNHTTPVSALKKNNMDPTASSTSATSSASRKNEGNTHHAHEIMNPTNLRRTPGANLMHQSAAPLHGLFPPQSRYNTTTSSSKDSSGVVETKPIEEHSSNRLKIDVDDANNNDHHHTANNQQLGSSTDGTSVLGFGLTLSTPVGASRPTGIHHNNGRNENVTHDNHNISDRKKKINLSNNNSNNNNFTPSDINMNPNLHEVDTIPSKNRSKVRGRDGYLYTPAGISLAKNRNLNLPSGSGAFSPNTIQLATNLDTLLDEDDDDDSKEDEKVDSFIEHQQQQHSPQSSPEKTHHSLKERETKFPTIHPVTSFGADSHVSAISNGVTNDDWYENFTLDTSLLDTTLDKSIDNDPGDGTYHRPKPVSLTAFQRSPSDISSGSHSVSDRSPDKDKQHLINLYARPSSGGAFSPPSKQSKSSQQQSSQQQQQQTFQPRQGSSFDATPTTATSNKVDESGRALNYHQQYLDHHNMGMNDFERNLEQNQPVIVHHQYNMQHPYGGGPNAHHTYNTGGYQQYDPIGPVFDPYQHTAESHTMSHTNYGHQPHAPHLAMSPVNVPVAVSPLTIPPYPPIHHSQYPSLSPAPFTSQQLAPIPWASAHHSHHTTTRDQSTNHWSGGGDDRGIWEQQQQPAHVVPPDYSYDANLYSRRDFGHPTLSTPTPPPLYSWPSSDHGESSSVGNIPLNPVLPGQTEASAYHMPPSNQHIQHDQPQLVNSHGLQHLSNQEFTNNKQKQQNNQTTSKENIPVSSRHQEETDAKNNNPLDRDDQTTKSNPVGKEKAPRNNKQTKKASKKQIQSNLKVDRTQPKKKTLNDQPCERKAKETNILQSAEWKPTKVKKDSRKVSNESKVKKKNAREDNVDAKRAELVESPATRSAFKEFYRKFRVQEKISLQHAANFALECLSDKSFPASMQWRIYLELADLSKRENRFNGARKLYSKVCTLQPYASQGWLEYSKLEEECGNLERCSMILSEGLLYCQFSENLLTRAIKHEERIAHEVRNGDLSEARQLLAPLKHSGIDKVWRTVLEGAMMEARAGNGIIARRVLKYLMHWVPWYGPLYLEAFRLERDSDRPTEALTIVERGLKEIPRYGPLWFGAFRLCEGLDLSRNDLDLPQTMQMIQRSIHQISKELLWKVHLEAAQALERAAHLHDNDTTSQKKRLDLSRKSFVQAVSCCPENLCWKVWLAAGRMELSAGRFDTARKLFLKSFSVVPEKGRPAVFLECARLEEFVGDLKLARAILTKSRTEAGSDWKVWLQSVSLEIRNSNHQRAIELAQEGLTAHPGTGRLWAALVQLRDKDGEDIQMNALKRALTSVPKSGEVWCEAARLFLNPMSSAFDLDTAANHLDFATKFTPQYGDSFLETVRLQLLQKWIAPIAEYFADKMKDSLKHHSTAKPINENVNECLRETADIFLRLKDPDFEKKLAGPDREALSCLNSSLADVVDTSELELRCCNADPNYGKLWFHCRQRPADTARTVLRRAKSLIAKDLLEHSHVYVTAMVRRSAVQFCEEIQSSGGNTKGISSSSSSDYWNFATISSLFSHDNEQDMQLLERGICRSRSDFVTGLVEINRVEDVQLLSLGERRKILFGSNDLI